MLLNTLITFSGMCHVSRLKGRSRAICSTPTPPEGVCCFFFFVILIFGSEFEKQENSKQEHTPIYGNKENKMDESPFESPSLPCSTSIMRNSYRCTVSQYFSLNQTKTYMLP